MIKVTSIAVTCWVAAVECSYMPYHALGGGCCCIIVSQCGSETVALYRVSLCGSETM